MKTAKELLMNYLDNINDPGKAIESFDDDATIELPYLATLGGPWQWQGKEVIYNFIKALPKTFPGFKFENIQIHIDTPDQVFAEYDARAIYSKTNLPYHQTYMGRVVAKDGKIKLLREALDMAKVIQAQYPNGIPAK